MFSENGSDYDVLRNYMYVFNITKCKGGSRCQSYLEYEVKYGKKKL